MVKLYLPKSLLKLKYYLHPYCYLCTNTCFNNLDFCFSCYKSLPWLSNICGLCGCPWSNTTNICPRCVKEFPVLGVSIIPFYYTFPVRELVLKLKYQQDLVSSKILSLLMLKKIQRYYFDKALPQCIVPVPSHEKRYQKRKFNQTVELSRTVAKKMQITLDLLVCSRIKYTDEQAKLSINKRKSNVSEVFFVDNIIYKHIAIVEDVVTTGSTLREMITKFSLAGVEKIDIWAVSRALVI